MKKKIISFVILMLVAMNIVLAAEGTSGTAEGSGLFQGIMETIGLQQGFDKMVSTFNDIVNNLRLIGMGFALLLSFLAFMLVAFGLYIWFPLKVYPTYIKYQNLINILLNKTKA
jgi:hypothetical protein